MKFRYLFFAVIFIIFCVMSENVTSQPTADRGKEFWFSMLPGTYDYDGLSEQNLKARDPRLNPDYYTLHGGMFIVAIYSLQPTTVEISIPRTSWKRTIYTGNTRAYYDSIPMGLIFPFHLYKPEDIGVHVIADHPISIVTSGSRISSSNGESNFIFPKEMLGTKYHIGSHHTVWNHSNLSKEQATKDHFHKSGYVVLATEDGTQINIEYGLPGWTGPKQITLQRGQTHIVRRDTGFASNILTANKPIAVFSQGTVGWKGAGINGFTSIAQSNGYAGSEQLLPVEQWGKLYYSVPMDNNPNSRHPTWTQVTASEDNTQIRINDRKVSLNRGKTFDTVATTPLVIIADKPVQVSQLAHGMSNPPPDIPVPEVGGEVFQHLLSKEKMQLGSTYFSAAPPIYGTSPGYNLNYITVITATKDTGKIYLDNKSIGGSFRPFAFDSAMSLAQVRVDERTVHELYSTARYHLYTFGWNVYNGDVSYSNATGLYGMAFSSTAGCDGTGFRLDGFADKGAIAWTWNFGDGSPEITTATLGTTDWGDATTRVMHNYTKGGTYNVQLRVVYDWSNGKEEIITRKVNVPNAPVINLSVDSDTLCYGQSTRLRADAGFDSYIWTFEGKEIKSNMPVPYEITVSKSGVYTVTATDNKGCSASDDIALTVLPELIAGITGANSTCINSTEEYRAEGVISSGNTNIVVGWAVTGGTLVSGQGTPIIGVRWTTQGTGLLKLEMRDAVTGCFKDTTISVEIGTGLTVAIAGNLAICDGTPTLLKAESGAGIDAEFEWYYNGNLLKGETEQTLSATATGKYRVKVTSATGCIGEATAEVKASALPEKPVIAGQPILCDEYSMTTLTLMNPEKYARFEWFHNNVLLKDETTPILTVLKAGQYSITVYNEAGCEATTEVNVTVLTLALNNDTIVCSGQSVELSAVSNEPNATFSWLPQAGLTNANSQNPVATPDVTTTYHVTLTTADGSCTRTDSITITVLKIPVITTKDISLCEGESAELWAVSDEPVVTWSWTPTTGLSNPNIQNPIITAFKSEVYTVTATNENGCTVLKTLSVTVTEKVTIAAVLKSDKNELEPGESTNVQFLLKAENKVITSFKAVVHFDANVFQFTKNSQKFLNGADNTWFLQADIIAPGELKITANGQTPIAMSELSFELTAYLSKQTSENILLKLTEINGEVLKEEEMCRTIETEGTKLVLKEACAGDMRLVNVGEFQTALHTITPNPVTNETIEINYSVGIEGEIKLEIYTSQGELIRTIFKGNQKAGVFKEICNTDEIAAGVFLMRLSTPQATESQMFTIVK